MSGARNVEIKAKLHDRAAVEAAVRSLAESGPSLLPQVDVFFRCGQGRLKLRSEGAGRAELIFYQRPDEPGPKVSRYLRVPVTDADALAALLTQALGSPGRVVKERTLYLVGRTRVHLDRVAGLGDFIELEVVLGEGEAADAGEAEARMLLERLGVENEALVSGAYADLLRGAS